MGKTISTIGDETADVEQQQIEEVEFVVNQSVYCLLLRLFCSVSECLMIDKVLKSAGIDKDLKDRFDHGLGMDRGIDFVLLVRGLWMDYVSTARSQLILPVSIPSGRTFIVPAGMYVVLAGRVIISFLLLVQLGSCW
ncbi:hypothetical protein Tco_0891742 [Tanacetum coccineum]|uniref:Uncharacterized protein n=1 Tax=Tanacetum coccineum TaxID=301880 RepID=A0ABQ5C3U2_9ASTR